MTEVIKQLEFAKLVADGEESIAPPVSSGIATSSTHRPSPDMASSSHTKSAPCEIVPCEIVSQHNWDGLCDRN
jgi:hypothetical protein